MKYEFYISKDKRFMLDLKEVAAAYISSANSEDGNNGVIRLKNGEVIATSEQRVENLIAYMLDK